MKNVRSVGLAIALAGSLLLSACSEDATGAGKDGAVTVGWIAQLSGAQAVFGEQSTNAVKLALEDIEAEGGPDIEVVYEDNEADPAKSVTAFQSMMSEDPVAVMSGGSSVVLALSPLATQNELVLANLAAQSPALTTDDHPWVYNFIPTGKAEAQELAQRVYDEGITKVATEMVDGDYGIDTTAEFTEAFEALGGEVVAAERHEFAGTDMRAQLRKIKESGAEGLVVAASVSEVGYIAAQAAELNLDLPLFGFTYALSPDNFKIAGDAMNGMRGVAVGFNAQEGPGRDFAEKYEAKYGDAPTTYAAVSYQTMRILADGIEQVGNDRAALRDYLADLQDYEGVMGTADMGEGREIELPLQAWEVDDSGKVGAWR